MAFNFNRVLSFVPQRLGSPGMPHKSEEVASIFGHLRRQDVFRWLPTGYGKSMHSKMIPFVTEVIPLVMDFKLSKVDMDRKRHMSLPICLGIDNYVHVQTVDTGPFFLRWVGPGNPSVLECFHDQQEP